MGGGVGILGLARKPRVIAKPLVPPSTARRDDRLGSLTDTKAPVKFVKNIFKGVQGLFGPGDKNGAPTLVSTVFGTTGSAAQALIPKGPLIPQSGQMQGFLNPLGSLNPLAPQAGQKNSVQHGVSSASTSVLCTHPSVLCQGDASCVGLVAWERPLTHSSSGSLA